MVLNTGARRRAIIYFANTAHTSHTHITHTYIPYMAYTQPKIAGGGHSEVQKGTLLLMMIWHQKKCSCSQKGHFFHDYRGGGSCPLSPARYGPAIPHTPNTHPTEGKYIPPHTRDKYTFSGRPLWWLSRGYATVLATVLSFNLFGIIFNKFGTGPMTTPILLVQLTSGRLREQLRKM